MGTGVAKIAPQQGKRVIEQGATRFPFIFHCVQEFIEATHDGAFDFQQLFDAVGIPSVMGEIVVIGFHAIYLVACHANIEEVLKSRPNVLWSEHS